MLVVGLAWSGVPFPAYALKVWGSKKVAWFGVFDPLSLVSLGFKDLFLIGRLFFFFFRHEKHLSTNTVDALNIASRGTGANPCSAASFPVDMVGPTVALFGEVLLSSPFFHVKRTWPT